jgi:hypothetical protein
MTSFGRTTLLPTRFVANDVAPIGTVRAGSGDQAKANVALPRKSAMLSIADVICRTAIRRYRPRLCKNSKSHRIRGCLATPTR